MMEETYSADDVSEMTDGCDLALDGTPSLLVGDSTDLLLIGGNESPTDDMAFLSPTSQCLEDDKLKMRRWVVTNILDSERAYLATLDILLQLMQTFRNLLKTDEAALTAADIDVIFCGIEELHGAHDLFVTELQPLVDSWSDEQRVAEPIKVLALNEYRISGDYVKNYQNAVSTISRCARSSQLFLSMSTNIEIQGQKEKLNLEQMLYTPVVRFQRNSLVLHDLINCTPTSHADYDPLQKTLIITQQFLENLDDESSDVQLSSPDRERYLVKHSLVVEKVGDARKLRLLFLFNDVLICAGQKKCLKQQGNYEMKWFVSLFDVSLDDRVNLQEETEVATKSERDMKLLQQAISELQLELRTETKHAKESQCTKGRLSLINWKHSIAKIRKKLLQKQTALIKASPKLLFRVHNRRHGQYHTLLMASDYERATWRTAIRDLLGRIGGTPSRQISASELHSLLSSKKLPRVGPLLSVDDLAFDEELLFGRLNTTICRIQGVTDTKEMHCTVEVDSFGQFSTKAKTKVASLPSAVWNENFEIELDGSQTVRVLVHSDGGMIGMCALELSKDWLTEQFQEKTISINKEMSLTISLSYSSRSRELRCRQHALPTTAGAVFGVTLQEVPKREGSQIPFVVAACVEEIESRGLEEEGLYRISGATSDIQRLKKTFEKKSKSALQQVGDADIAALTGLVKLYFRELPDGLLTSQVYRDIVKSRSLTEPEAKRKYIVSLLNSLPEPNKSTLTYIIDHILRVADHEASNRMSLRNLAMVFGPTLLRCSSRTHGAQTLEQLVSKGPHEVVVQSSLLHTILELRASGVQF